jgi:imidazoleglycerol-phosphate dehydratase
MRRANLKRETAETTIDVTVNLDGKGVARINTPINFLNHMLTSLSTHSLIDISLVAEGDLKHHIVEDCALSLGEVLREAMGDYRGIKRFGYAIVPMDCSLATVSIDQSKRPYPVIDIDLEREVVEDLPSEDIVHFFTSLAFSMMANLHVRIEYGENDHHKVEAAFKALALALREAISEDSRRMGVPSSKGVL